MSKKMSAAKTVSHSPMRPNQDKAFLKNALDNPFKTKWPVLSQTAVKTIKEQLESSLQGLKELITSRTRRREKKNRNRIRKRQRLTFDEELPATKRKRISKEDSLKKNLTDGTQEAKLGDLPDPSTVETSECPKNDNHTTDTETKLCVPLQEESIPVCDTSPAKKTQLIIGVNAVTRLLEGGTLEAGLLCSSSPRVLCQHVLPLAATRGVPFAAVPDLSSEVARLLGIKRVMCLGLKKPGDHFEELCSTIASVAPPCKLSWLSLEEGQIEQDVATPSSSFVRARESGSGKRGAVYSPLQVKRTKPNPKRKRK